MEKKEKVKVKIKKTGMPALLTIFFLALGTLIVMLPLIYLIQQTYFDKEDFIEDQYSYKKNNAYDNWEGDLHFYRQYTRTSDNPLGVEELALINNDTSLYFYGTLNLPYRNNNDKWEMNTAFQAVEETIEKDFKQVGYKRFDLGSIKTNVFKEGEVKVWKYGNQEGNIWGQTHR